MLLLILGLVFSSTVSGTWHLQQIKLHEHSCGVPLDNFGPEIDFLLNHLLVPSTARSYNRVIEMSSFFRKDLGLPVVWPALLQDITAFVAYMYKLGLSSILYVGFKFLL